MYNDRIIEAAIRESVFTMTAKMSDLLREEVANGEMSDLLMKEDFDTKELRSRFLSVTTSASHMAFSKFLSTLKGEESTFKFTDTSESHKSSVSAAADLAAMFRGNNQRKADPSKAVLNEEAIMRSELSEM